MLRWTFFIRYPDGVDRAEGERWYLGTHTQEAKQLAGLRRYVSWRAEKARVAPVWSTVERLNRWERVTELVFDDWESWHDAAVKNVPQYTAAPYGKRGFEMETIFLGEEPDNDFLGNSPTTADLGADEKERLIRWLFILRYPENISKEQGEDWYLGTHTQEAKLMHGLRRYVSRKAQPVPDELAGVARQKWDRLTELAFADWAAWEDGAVSRMPDWTPPPYGNPGFLSETVFIREEPEYDFLREVPKVR
jgi:hypothetical protein